MSLPVLVVIAVIVGVIIQSIISRQSKRGKAVERMRSLWGRAHERTLNGRNPTLYHNLKTEQEDEWSIDDQTWEDLYLTNVFRAIDHTRSRPGSQILYDLLRTPSLSADEIAFRDRIIGLFASRVELREKMQAALETLESDDAGLLPNLFFLEIPSRPVGYLIYPLLMVCCIVGIGVLIFHPFSWPFMLPLLLTNLLMAQSYRGKIQPWIQPLRVLNALVSVAGQLDGLITTVPSDPDLDTIVTPLRENRDALRVLDGVTRWLLLERNATGDMGFVIEYINMVLLLDVNAFVLSIEAVRKHKQLIRTLFETVGKIDALIGIASYRHSISGYCAPVFTEQGKHLRIEEGLHPQLPRGVANSLTIDGRSILITGSNMSGKTTFIRTVAVNAVLAQTVATCLAKHYEAPLLRVETSIGRTDSLAEGKSYYMAEVERIGEFLADAAGSVPFLFVIDEIYRGTNTTERVAASKAVLDAMNRPDGPHIVLVSTHDIELSFLLQTGWDRYHFQEAVENGELIFDYKIRSGLCSSRNALRLLATQNYPAGVIADAEATAAQIDLIDTQTSTLQTQKSALQI